MDTNKGVFMKIEKNDLSSFLRVMFLCLVSGFVVGIAVTNVTKNQQENSPVIYNLYKDFPIVKIQKDAVTGDIIRDDGTLTNKLFVNGKRSDIYVEIVPDGKITKVPYSGTFHMSEIEKGKYFIIFALSE